MDRVTGDFSQRKETSISQPENMRIENSGEHRIERKKKEKASFVKKSVNKPIDIYPTREYRRYRKL